MKGDATMPTRQIRKLATDVVTLARAQGVMLATAESCTGGLVIGALTDIAGCSHAVDRGFVTYSNAAKTAMLGVPAALIERHGAVSAEVAGAMALGALKASGAGFTVAITGIAGPDGGSEARPVGLVHFAAASSDGRVNRIERRFGDRGRDQVRRMAVAAALDLLKGMLEETAVQST